MVYFVQLQFIFGMGDDFDAYVKENKERTGLLQGVLLRACYDNYREQKKDKGANPRVTEDTELIQ